MRISTPVRDAIYKAIDSAVESLEAVTNSPVQPSSDLDHEISAIAHIDPENFGINVRVQRPSIHELREYQDAQKRDPKSSRRPPSTRVHAMISARVHIRSTISL